MDKENIGEQGQKKVEPVCEEVEQEKSSSQLENFKNHFQNDTKKWSLNAQAVPDLEAVTSTVSNFNPEISPSIEPLNLSVKKQRKSIDVEKANEKNNEMVLETAKSPPSCGFSPGCSLQSFGMSFSHAISNIFHSEFPHGVHQSNYQNYYAFLTAAATLYPYVLRSWFWQLYEVQRQGTSKFNFPFLNQSSLKKEKITPQPSILPAEIASSNFLCSPTVLRNASKGKQTGAC